MPGHESLHRKLLVLVVVIAPPPRPGCRGNQDLLFRSDERHADDGNEGHDGRDDGRYEVVVGSHSPEQDDVRKDEDQLREWQEEIDH